MDEGMQNVYKTFDVKYNIFLFYGILELNFKLAASATCLSSSSSSATRRRTAERKSRSGKKPYDRKM